MAMKNTKKPSSDLLLAVEFIELLDLNENNRKLLISTLYEIEMNDKKKA